MPKLKVDTKVKAKTVNKPKNMTKKEAINFKGKKPTKLKPKDIVIRGKKTTKPTKIITKEVYKANIYNTLLDKVEKEVGAYSESLTNFKISCGTRCVDLILGGGMRTYGFITLAGKETGGKTTLLMQAMRQMLKYEVPIIDFDDAENALDPKFAASILRVNKIEDVLGLRHENKWIVPPKVRYYDTTLMDKVYDRWEKILNRIPDKIYQPELDQWFLVIDKTNKKLEPMQKLLGEPNEKLSDKERLWYPTDNPYPQVVLFVDSWNDLNPSRDDGKEGAENALAMWARGYAKNSPRIMGSILSKKVLIIGTGHIKQNPGARFQCLHGETLIPLVDGRSFTIREIVDQKIEGQVWSLNEKKNKLEPKNIIGYHQNGKVSKKKEWITITTRAPDTDNGYAAVTITPDHEIMTNVGWLQAKDITTSHKVVSSYKTIAKVNRPFLYAALVGDCSMIPDTRSIHTLASFSNSEQTGYNKWKADKFGQLFDMRADYPGKNGSLLHSTKPNYFFSVMNKKMKFGRNPLNLHKHFNLMSLAIRFMDDGNHSIKQYKDSEYHTGSISYKRYKNDPKMMNLINSYYRKLGYNTKVHTEGKIFFGVKTFDKFARDIAKYIHPELQYKLPEQYRGKFEDFDLVNKNLRNTEYTQVTQINKGSDRKFRMKGKYDISVQDNKNYLAGSLKNGMIVHNSPDYESGGNKLKHDSMVRNWITPRAIPPEWQIPGQKTSAREEPSVEGKGNDIYQYKHIGNKKNKWATPLQETWMRVWVSNYKGLGRGVDPVFDIYYFLEQIGYLSIAQKKTITFGKADWPLTDKKLDWLDFKVLIIYEDGNKSLKDQADTVYSKLKLDKPFKFMPFCDKLNQSGVAATELRNAKLSKAEKKKADLSDDLEDD